MPKIRKVINFTGKVVIVTGGSTGIGEGCVRAFCAAGGTVVFCARHKERGEILAEQLNAKDSGICHFERCDVSNPDEVHVLIDKTAKQYKRLDCLVNNIGYPPPRPIDKFSIKEFNEVVGFSPSGAKDTFISRMLIDGESVGAKRLSLNHFVLRPGKDTGGGKHPYPYEEIYYILRGRGILTVGDKTCKVGPDTVAYISYEEYHKLENIGDTDLEILTVWSLPIKEGANPIYDARKRLWGTSFKKVVAE